MEDLGSSEKKGGSKDLASALALRPTPPKITYKGKNLNSEGQRRGASPASGKPPCNSC